MPTLFLAAGDDVPIPVTDVRALFDRAPEPWSPATQPARP